MEFRITASNSVKQILIAAESWEEAKELARKDGYEVLKVEGRETGEWVLIWNK